jgi:hypothetical protein
VACCNEAAACKLIPGDGMHCCYSLQRTHLLLGCCSFSTATSYSLWRTQLTSPSMLDLWRTSG